VHPALSIIVFTTLSGTGLGLGFWTALTAAGTNTLLIVAAALLAAAITSAGLLSSLLHLRRPSRAWRAFSQWRSSWLSREGILAPLCVFSMLLLVIATTADIPLGRASSLLVLLLAPAVILTTAMIYTQLRAVPAWHTWLTPAMFFLFAAASGLYVLLAIAAWLPGDADQVQIIIPTDAGLVMEPVTLLLTATLINALAWGIMLAWWVRRDRIGTGQSTLATATRLANHGPIAQLDPPHTEPNYPQTEMGYRVARKHALKLRWIATLLGFLCPTLVGGIPALLPSAFTPLALTSLCALHLIGVMISRWLFFAEAAHVQSVYYQSG